MRFEDFGATGTMLRPEIFENAVFLFMELYRSFWEKVLCDVGFGTSSLQQVAFHDLK